jgi:hypothetical protein
MTRPLSDDQPSLEHRSFVDVTVDRQTMLKVRDRHRQELVERYHHLLIVARLNRKVGKLALARESEEQARCTTIMIWCLDNPMDAVPPPETGGGQEQAKG